MKQEILFFLKKTVGELARNVIGLVITRLFGSNKAEETPAADDVVSTSEAEHQ